MQSATSSASADAAAMKFGEKVRSLRKAKGWSLRALAEKVGVGFTYLSRVENERLNFGDYPSDSLIYGSSDKFVGGFALVSGTTVALSKAWLGRSMAGRKKVALAA